MYPHSDPFDPTGSATTPVITTDAHGNALEAGDSVIAIKDLKVKGSPDIKRGDVFKNIRLTVDPGQIESGKMVLKTEFFKKKK